MLAGALLVLTAGPALGQATATLRGRVIDDETGEPVKEATIRVSGHPAFSADSSGRFELGGLSAGELTVTIQALGFVSQRVRVFLAEGQIVDRTFPMEFSGEKLPDVVVTERAQRLTSRYADFERRRERGIGAFYRWDEIKKRGFSSVGDALRTVRGVRIQCDQRAFECAAVMSRTPGCSPRWWIDGVAVGSFHENTPIRDLYGIEVYRGVGEVPAEFTGSTAACGVIVMWTKSRPYR